MVAVAALIWLSTSDSCPVASFCAPSRFHASTVIAPFCSSSITRKSSSCGRLKITAMGSSWVMTTSPFASLARTRLPGSTRRTPVTPSSGDLMLA